MSKLNVLIYTKNEYKKACHDIYDEDNKWIYYHVENEYNGTLRKCKLGKIQKHGAFTYYIYYTDEMARDPKIISRLKGQICAEIIADINEMEHDLKHAREQFNSFLYSKIGEN